MKFVNSKGSAWYLQKKNVIIGRNKLATLTYFFSKKIDDSIELPKGYTVMETRTGMPVVKRI